jgi:hypothetical protein
VRVWFPAVSPLAPIGAAAHVTAVGSSNEIPSRKTPAMPEPFFNILVTRHPRHMPNRPQMIHNGYEPVVQRTCAGTHILEVCVECSRRPPLAQSILSVIKREFNGCDNSAVFILGVVFVLRHPSARQKEYETWELVTSMIVPARFVSLGLLLGFFRCGDKTATF